MELILALLTFFALVWAAGFGHFVKRSKKLTIIALIVSIAICCWAGHYYKQLSAISDLSADLQWHRIYVLWILWLIPSSLVIGGLFGLILHQKAYLSQYVGLTNR